MAERHKSTHTLDDLRTTLQRVQASRVLHDRPLLPGSRAHIDATGGELPLELAIAQELPSIPQGEWLDPRAARRRNVYQGMAREVSLYPDVKLERDDPESVMQYLVLVVNEYDAFRNAHTLIKPISAELKKRKIESVVRNQRDLGVRHQEILESQEVPTLPVSEQSNEQLVAQFAQLNIIIQMHHRRLSMGVMPHLSRKERQLVRQWQEQDDLVKTYEQQLRTHLSTPESTTNSAFPALLSPRVSDDFKEVLLQDAHPLAEALMHSQMNRDDTLGELGWRLAFSGVQHDKLGLGRYEMPDPKTLSWWEKAVYSYDKHTYGFVSRIMSLGRSIRQLRALQRPESQLALQQEDYLRGIDRMTDSQLVVHLHAMLRKRFQAYHIFNEGSALAAYAAAHDMIQIPAAEVAIATSLEAHGVEVDEEEYASLWQELVAEGKGLIAPAQLGLASMRASLAPQGVRLYRYAMNFTNRLMSIF